MEHRPLFHDEHAFTKLFTERLPYYRLADFSIPTEGRKPEEVVEQILSLRVF
jgi:shikimate kinase